MAEYNKLRTIAFDEHSYSLGVQQHRHMQIEFVEGIRGEWLKSHNYEGTHLYHLLKLPLQCKWSNSDNLLDPTSGETLNIKLTPSSNFLTPTFFYTIHTTSLAAYHSIFKQSLTFAAKGVIGNIIGAARHTIPPPDRFYGGSENVLRGYRAYSVSPLRHHRTPIGPLRFDIAIPLDRRRHIDPPPFQIYFSIGQAF